MTFCERIKKLRKALDLTQQEFADRIGSKRNTVATYEMGRTEPSAAVVSLICREFNASEEWLRTGKGEMFVPAPSGALDTLAKEYHLSSAAYILIRRFLELKPDAQQAFVDYAVRVAEDFAAGNIPQSQAKNSVAAAEALYEKSLGIAPSKDSTALNTTGDAKMA